jgi:uncharacterized protein with HEPN domain
MDDRDEVRLRHMLDAAQKAMDFIQGRTRQDLDSEAGTKRLFYDPHGL